MRSIDEDRVSGRDRTSDEDYHQVSIIGNKPRKPAKLGEGLTAAAGRPLKNLSRPTAPRGGPTDNDKGSTASRGGSQDTDDDSKSSGSSGPTGGIRKRPLENLSPEDPAKQSRTDEGSNSQELPGPLGITQFDPASLVRSKEGTFKALKLMKKYLDMHLRRCLTKEEWEALFKKHPRPDLDSCVAPKVDKYMGDFLGKRLPKEHDAELAKIQTAVLASVRLLTSAWQHLS